MSAVIRGRCTGLEAEPVWETPLPDGHAERIAGLLEAVRVDWRDRPAPASGYRIDLAYTPATGNLSMTMGPQDPTEEPPGDLTPPFPMRPAAPDDIESASPPATAIGAGVGGVLGMVLERDHAAFRERVFRSMGIDPNNPATAALLEEIAADGVSDHWSQAAPPIDPDHPLIHIENTYRARLESEATDQ
jgi:hypothetical protein